MRQSASSRQQRRQHLQRSTSVPAADPAGARAPLREATWKPTPVTALMLAPLRLFLGITFVYAGIQKLTDPQFFAPGAPGYIGRQITAFAAGSPLRAFLLQFALPHATLFGSMVAWGELAIGIGTLLGLLLRPAALFGALLSLLFFLSASWRVHPYFYGSDIVFLFAWLTLFITGPIAGGWFALDSRLVAWVARKVPAESTERLVEWSRVVLGVQPAMTRPPSPAAHHSRVPTRNARVDRYPSTNRRQFLRGAFAGVATTFGAVLAITLFSKGGPTTAESASGTPTSASGDTATATTAAGASPTSAATSGVSIANASQIPVNSAASFNVPSNGDPGVLVHLSDGSFVAFDAACTHAGCPVQYDPSSKLLLCPCHGAAFDPSHGAEVVQGPAEIPLVSVAVQVDHTTGAITVNG